MWECQSSVEKSNRPMIENVKLVLVCQSIVDYFCQTGAGSIFFSFQKFQRSLGKQGLNHSS